MTRARRAPRPTTLAAATTGFDLPWHAGPFTHVQGGRGALLDAIRSAGIKSLKSAKVGPVAHCMRRLNKYAQNQGDKAKGKAKGNAKSSAPPPKAQLSIADALKESLNVRCAQDDAGLLICTAEPPQEHCRRLAQEEEARQRRR